ncbi:MAG: PAS domain S-box protein [Desulfobacca sp.]|nr:PAS domain S-box protein [Desulfobacca sp.]
MKIEKQEDCQAEITEYQGIEANLSKNLEKYRLLIDHISDVVYATDRQGATIFITPNVEKVYGFTPEEIYQAGAQIWWDRIHPEDLEKVKQAFELLFTNHQKFDVEYRIQRKDGKWIWLHDRCLGTFQKQGTVYAEGVFSDISERKQIEAELRQAKQGLELRVQERTSDLTHILEQLQQEIAARQHTEKRIEHLNAVLRAVRNVNQLITQEKDRDRLIQRACDNLIETRGYFNAWIALFDESGRLVQAAESGLGDNFQALVEHLQRGELTKCARQALAQSAVVITVDPPSACEDCPLACQYQGRGAITGQLAYGGKTYGLLSVSIPAEMATDPEELELFEEVAGDLGFALHSIELREERQRAEEARQKSELSYRLLVKNIPAMVFKGYSDWSVDLVDDRTEVMTGYVKAEFDSRRLKWSDLVLAEDRPAAKDIFVKALKSDGDYVREYRIRKKDGDIIWIQERSQIICRPDGRIDYISGVFFDITEQKQWQEDLKASELFLQEVFDAIQDGITVRDCYLNITKVNRWVEEKYPNQMPLVGKKCYAAFQQRQSPCPWCPALPTMQTGQVHTQVIPYPSLENCQGWFELSAFPLKNAQGEVIGIIEHVKDITARKLAEEALKASEAQMRHIIEASPIGIRMAQHEKLVYANPAFIKMLGYNSAAEILGQPVSSLVIPEQRELVRERHLDRIAGREAPSNYEITGLRKSGEPFDAAVWLTIIDYQGAPATLGFVVDLSAEKTLRTQLQQAQKMEAVGTLASGIAHDFNNVLQAIQGGVEMLLLDSNTNQQGHAGLKEIERAAQRGATLIQQLLTYSRRVESKPSPINLNHTVERVKGLLDRTIPRMIDIELQLAADLQTINADANQIEQVLLNLGVNARDAMPEGGRLILATENVTLDEQFCQTHLGCRPGNYVLLSVTDTGCGMTPEILGRIFEPFFTTKGVGQGTGLGLPMVYGIVKSHEGYIWCDSAPGLGTIFKIYLPALPETGQVLEIPEKAAAPPQAGTEKILVVDDYEILRDLNQRMLGRFGYQVITAGSGEAALEIYRHQPQSIDLVILDLSMPGMGGKKCLEELFRLNPQARVLITSGLADATVAEQALQAGARGFIGKPYNLKKLLKKVREVLDQS